MRSTDGLRFTGRLVENRKSVKVKAFDLTFRSFNCGVLKEDSVVQLYGYEHVTKKTGKDVKKQFVAPETYRVIRFRPHGKKDDVLLITHIFNLRAEMIALMYRQRWDMEVFFRLLKQEVSFSHFLSLNPNGMEVILYMTLTVAMMIMIYKKENETGIKMAKRRITTEVQEAVMAVTVMLMVGNDEDLKKRGLSSP
jgi:IS4 transposase